MVEKEQNIFELIPVWISVVLFPKPLEVKSTAETFT